MKLKILTALIALTLGVAAASLRHRDSSSVPVAPIALTVMGEVADSNELEQRKALEDFTRGHGLQIRFAESLQSVNEQIELLLALLRNRSPEPDLLEMDVIWPGTLAPYMVDLRPYFADEIGDFAPELMKSFIVNGRLVALPTFIDEAVLYYRVDLLKKYGFAAPPATWDELERMSTRIQAGERRAGKHDFWGYVWQGGAYESLTCNALEWQASSGGGEILTPAGNPQVSSPQFEHSLERAVSWIGRISPPGESAFGEDDSSNFFLRGKAAFMRNWTGAYTGIMRSDNPVREVTAVAALPGGEGGHRGTLGGAGTGIPKSAAHPKEALAALRYVVSENAQRERALHGYIPSRIALREQVELMAHTALHGTVADQVIRGATARPAIQSGLLYNRVSKAYYTNIHAVLARKTTPAQGVAQLESELIKITGKPPLQQ